MDTNKIDFKYYDKNEFEIFLSGLNAKEAVKLLKVISKIEHYGIEVSIKQKWVKKLDNNLYEIRSKHASNIQRAIYFQYVGNAYVITHGFVKKQQKTPINDINKGKRTRDNYLRIMGAGKHD